MVFDQLCEFIFSFVWLREWIFEIEKDSFDVVLATDLCFPFSTIALMFLLGVLKFFGISSRFKLE